jgi:hypothetical protein
VSDDNELDILKKEMLKNISEIDFRDFFAKASKCSDDNSRILLVVKPETYDKIAQTPFLDKEYFKYLVEIMRDKLYDNIELVVKMPKDKDIGYGEIDSMTLGNELDLDDLDNLESFENLDDFDEEDETKHLTFLLTKKIKVLLVVENKDDYLCIRKWAAARIRNMKERIKILEATSNGIQELFEDDYHKIIKKSMEQKISIANMGICKDAEGFKKFSDIMIAIKKSISPSDSEVSSFVDFMLMDEELFIKAGQFNIQSFTTIPSFITKNFGPLTQRIKESINNKDEGFKGQIETIKKTITGLDEDKDLSFFILSEIIKDISFTIVRKLYLSNDIVQEYINKKLTEFDNIMSILSNQEDENMMNLRLAIKDIIIPYLNTGWKDMDTNV